MGKLNFEYYIFIDYSEDFLGYLIISQKKISEALKNTLKFAHYRHVKNKRAYLKSIRDRTNNQNLRQYFITKVRKTSENFEIYNDILAFLKENPKKTYFYLR